MVAKKQKMVCAFIIPLAYEVCLGIYSFRLSIGFVRPSVPPSVPTSVNILRQSFA